MSDWLPDIEMPPLWFKTVVRCVVCDKEFMRRSQVNASAVTCSLKCRRERHLAKQREHAKRWRTKKMSSGKK